MIAMKESNGPATDSRRRAGAKVHPAALLGLAVFLSGIGARGAQATSLHGCRTVSVSASDAKSTIRMSQYFCWNNGSVTYVANKQYDYDISLLGYNLYSTQFRGVINDPPGQYYAGTIQTPVASVYSPKVWHIKWLQVRFDGCLQAGVRGFNVCLKPYKWEPWIGIAKNGNGDVYCSTPANPDWFACN